MSKEKVVLEEKKPMMTAKEEISNYTAKAQKALTLFEDYTQEQVDHIVHEMALAAMEQHMPLAKMAVEETGRGVYEDKCIKNMYAAENIWHSIKKIKQSVSSKTTK